jgi:hypothetical protein
VRLGAHETGTAHLEQAISAHREALKELTRERAPIQWIAVQMDIGIALEKFGERESGTAHLEQAISTYREALRELARDRAPPLWAALQINLGNALTILGSTRVARPDSRRLPLLMRMRSRNGAASTRRSSGPPPRAVRE